MVIKEIEWGNWKTIQSILAQLREDVKMIENGSILLGDENKINKQPVANAAFGI